MTRQRMFLDMSCVDAARERMRHIYDIFDTVCVQFSGGKDSTAALLLAKEIHEERNLGPVKAIFRDEEMVSPSVLRYMEWIREQPWIDLEWYCLPMAQEVWVLGQRFYLLLWSKTREDRGYLVREKPEWAITAESFGLDPYKSVPEPIDYYTMQGKAGMTAFVMGVRANESMMRYRSCVQKLHENYIVQPYQLKKSIPLRFAKPIYDWTTDDVLKFIADEHDFPYCEYYDLANLSGANSRVGIPLHSVAIRRINDVVVTEPEFYDQLYRVFPQIDAQRRLWKDFDIERLIADYSSDGWDGVRDCIADSMLTPGTARSAMNYASKYRKKHATDPWSYPIEWLIRTLMLNEFHSMSPTPIGPKTKAHSQRMKIAQEIAAANSLDAMDDLR